LSDDGVKTNNNSPEKQPTPGSTFSRLSLKVMVNGFEDKKEQVDVPVPGIKDTAARTISWVKPLEVVNTDIADRAPQMPVMPKFPKKQDIDQANGGNLPLQPVNRREARRYLTSLTETTLKYDTQGEITERITRRLECTTYGAGDVMLLDQ
jgi:hypothetical protein